MDFLFWFIMGMAFAYVLARYNESSKLFLTLAFGTLIGITGAKIVNALMTKENVNTSIQTSPTQSLVGTVGQFALIEQNEWIPVTASCLPITTTKVTASVAVSKDNLSELKEGSNSLSKVYGRTRDQPHSFFDTS